MDQSTVNEILLSTSPPEKSAYSKLGAFGTGFSVGIISQTVSTPIHNILRLIPESFSLSYAVQEKYKNNGIKSFWEGNIENCIAFAPKVAFQFLFYHSMLSPVSEQNTKTRFKVSALSGVLSNTICYPFTLLKKLSVHDDEKVSIFKTADNVLKKDGVLGFYKGFFDELPFSIISESIQSILFSSMSKNYRIRQSFPEKLYYSVSTSLLSKFFTHPIHIMKQNCYQYMLQNPEKKGILLKHIASSTKQLYREKKIFGFYDGFLTSLAEDIPQMSVTFMLLEEVGRFLEHRRKLIRIQELKERKPVVVKPTELKTWTWF